MWCGPPALYAEMGKWESNYPEREFDSYILDVSWREYEAPTSSGVKVCYCRIFRQMNY